MSRYDTEPREVEGAGLKWREQFNCYRTRVGYAEMSVVWDAEGYRVTFLGVSLKKRFRDLNEAMAAGVRFARKSLVAALEQLPREDVR